MGLIHVVRGHFRAGGYAYNTPAPFIPHLAKNTFVCTEYGVLTDYTCPGGRGGKGHNSTHYLAGMRGSLPRARPLWVKTG